MKPETENHAAQFGIFCAGAALTVAAVFSHAWALSLLWKWFVCPFGVRPIGIAWAIGLGLIMGIVGGSPKIKEKNYLRKMAYAALGAPILAGIGWIVHFWI